MIYSKLEDIKLLKIENFYYYEIINKFLNDEISFPYIDIEKCISTKDILIKLILSRYENKQDKYNELKIILSKLINSKNKYKFKFVDKNLENININKNYSIENEINICNDKIFNIYKELSKLSLIENSKFNLILETYYIMKDITLENFKGSLKGKILVTSGFGDTGIAISQATKYLGGVSIVIDINPYILRKRQEQGFCDYIFEDFNSAFDFAFYYKKEKQSKIIGLLGNGSEVVNKILNEALLPDIITDSTNTDLDKYLPAGYDYYDAIRINKVNKQHSRNISKHSIMSLVKAMLELQKRGSFVFEFCNNFRQVAFDRGLDNAFAIKDIEKIVYNNLFSEQKLNFKLFDFFLDKENFFIINDLLYEVFSYDNDIKINTEIFLSLSDKNINAYYLKIDKDKLLDFFNKFNEIIKNKEIRLPILLSNYYLNNKNIFKKEDLLINIVSFYKNFLMKEYFILLNDKKLVNID
ncbi:MAG: hypothetical protein KatS3mg068_0020 [Candidatus Sericytochromatia bacterium]|nr:MAG: hypothetical protein KatS3mg068_0020 [Candidatus Sericytochromatia bacterium]